MGGTTSLRRTYEKFFFFARCCLGEVPGGAPFSQLKIARTGQIMRLCGSNKFQIAGDGKMKRMREP